MVSGILAEQGLMQEDERTLVHDRVAFGESYALGDQRQAAESKHIRS